MCGRFTLVLKKAILLALRLLNISGAKEVSFGKAKSHYLRLNKLNRIGPKNSIVNVPKDKFIFRSILRYGEWEYETSKFLASKILKLDTNKKILFLDIGAHVGLITLQIAQNLRRNGFMGSNFQFLCIEPVTSNFNFCARNLSEVVGEAFKWDVRNIALGDTNTKSLIHINNENFGDSSLHTLGPKIDSSDEFVTVVDTQTFSEIELSQFDAIILKCDTQGYDVKILARIPNLIWSRITSLVVEIESYTDLLDTDMKMCLGRFMDFNYKSFFPSGNDQVSKEEIRKVWTSKSHETRNLYLSKN
jgi:FkbM family methyltransferase